MGGMRWMMLITVPMFVIMALMKDRGGLVGKFVKAGACAPERAKRLETVGVTRNDRLHLNDAIRRGILMDLGDGRYWANQEAMRLRTRKHMITAGVAGLVIALTAIVVWEITAH